MSEPALFRLHLRRERSQWSRDMVGGSPLLHMVTEPMRYADCEAKMVEVRAALDRPERWEFTIEPEAEVQRVPNPDVKE